MDKIEALTLLSCAVRNDEISALNKSLTRGKVVEIVESAVESQQLDVPLDSLLERRVYEAVKNKKLPKIKKSGSMKMGPQSIHGKKELVGKWM